MTHGDDDSAEHCKAMHCKAMHTMLQRLAQKKKPPYGHLSAKRNPKCPQVSFQTAYLKRNMSFDRSGIRFEFR